MKKFYAFALIFIALFSCVFFSACGNKYKNLNMSFVNADGDELTEINLLIDDQNETALSEMSLSVKFSGIKSKDIGNVQIYCPQDKVTIPQNEITFSNNTFYFVAHANASGAGSIVVKHLASNKTSKLNVFVDKKSHNLTTLNNKYIISIPTTEKKVVSFNPNVSADSEIKAFNKELFTLSPQDSTDLIYYALAPNQNGNFNAQINNGNLSLSTININGSEVIDNLTVLSAANDATFTVYPVAVMAGYENKVYDTQPITVALKTVLTNENLAIKTDDLHQPYLNNGETIVLIANDHTAVNYENADGTEWSYEYYYLPVEVGSVQGESINSLDSGYYDFYELSVSADNPNIDCKIDDVNKNRVLICAVSNISTPKVKVTISLRAKNCVGEIYDVSKEVYVKAELKPETIGITMQGERLITNNEEQTYELYDYYYENDNLGALFEFLPFTNLNDVDSLGLEAFADMTNMHIVVDPSILNVYGNFNNQLVGEMPVYENANFEGEKITNFVGFNNVRTMYRLLNFYVNDGNHPMRFYYNTATGQFVSEMFDKNDRIYIKYVTNSSGESPKYLTFAVENVYSGDLQYLKSIKGCEKVNAYFENSVGVEKTTIFAGQIVNEGKDVTTFGNEVGELDSKEIYLNRLSYLPENLEANSGAYVLYISEVLAKTLNGVKSEINSTKFDVYINPINVYPEQNSNQLLIQKYNPDNDKLGLNALGAQAIKDFDYTKAFANNSIIFVFDSHTQIGEYEITIEHGNGYRKTIKCFVYENLTEQELQIAYTLQGRNDFAYVNRENNALENYVYSDYAADFIVAVNAANDRVGYNRRYNFWFVVQDAVLKSNLIQSYTYNATLQDKNTDEYLTIKPSSADIRNASSADLIFKKGTFDAATRENEYISIQFVVKLANFNKLFKVEGADSEKDIVVTRTFFVYEPVFNSDISIANVPTSDRFSKNDLGVYYEDRANINLSIEIADNLKNYIQKASQNAQFGQSVVNDFAVIWSASAPNIYNFISQDDFSLNVDIVGENIDPQDVTITATIKQFGRTISKTCTIHIGKPVLTDRIEIVNLVDEGGFKSHVQVNVAEQKFYINLKENAGGVQVNAITIANNGKLTFNDDNNDDNLIFVVVDRVGNKSRDAIDIEGNKISIASMAKNIKLIVFAKDALMQKVEDMGSIVNPSAILKAGHQNAYFEMDLMLSNGSKDNPFIIDSADDFWQIKNGDESYYMLMDNINLNTASLKHLPIENFSGQIDTYSYKPDGAEVEIPVVYTISGIELNDRFTNLFKTFNGKILNVNFDIDFNYNTSYGNLGLIDSNAGELTNVSLNISGEATINGSSANFGALAAVNELGGKINYTSNDIVGVSGKITLLGGAQVMFGGLVGNNKGAIEGYSGIDKTLLDNRFSNSEVENGNIVFSVMLWDSGATASLEINALSLANNLSAVGGVVGLNEGRINNAYSTGKINANCIAGGIIGQNSTTPLTLSITNADGITDITPSSGNQYMLQNLTSSMLVSGADYVGGIVGQDAGGSYYNCHTQILTGDSVAISGANYVGGIAGYSRFGTFAFCSVMSYRWDYNSLSQFNSAEVADIYGENFVGGFVGLAESGLDNLNNETNEYANVTTIMYSSVNALLVVENNGEIYGLLNSNSATTHSIIYNAYFMGKLARLQSGVFEDVELQNEEVGEPLAVADKNAIYNYVYSVNILNAETQEVFYSNEQNAPFDKTTAPNGDVHWATSGGINGGYIFISIDGKNPIFEQSPTKIDSTVIDPLIEGEKYLMHLYFYDFVVDATSENYQNTLTALNNEFNRYRILSTTGETGLINIDIEPEISGIVRIIAESSSSILSVSGNYILINGLGECTLTFYSALNPSVRCTIDVIITAPVGDDYVISTGKADTKLSIESSVQQIAKNKSKEFYSISNAYKSFKFNGTEKDYEFKTSNDVYLEVKITPTSVLGAEDKVGNYLSISGVTPQENSATSLKLELTPSTPFSVTVKKHLENGAFNFSVKPFTKLTYKGTSYNIYEKDIETAADKQINFILQTYEGPTQIRLSSEQIIIYPNGTSDVYAHITTDLPIAEDDLNDFSLINGITLDGKYVNKKDYIKYIKNSSSFDGANKLQIAKFVVKFNENLHIQQESELTIFFALPNQMDSASITFILEPQRIDHIEIKNYVYDYDKDNNLIIKPSDMLRPTGSGLAIINLSPINSYYEYLEIIDLNESGDENIIFTQIDGINGNRLDKMEIVTADGRGIRLNKINNQITPLYVSMFIDSRATSKLHTVRVSAYDKFGELIISNEIVIDIKMLPEIEMEYVDPNGVNFTDSNGILYLANGVPANLSVTTKNSNGDVVITGTIADSDLQFDDYFEIIPSNSGYILSGKYNADLINKTITLTATTHLTLNDGTTEEVKDTLQFKVAEYVVHNVSVNNSSVNFGYYESETTRIINGDFGVPTILNFYFNYFDISYLETNGTYWDKQYEYNPNISSSNASEQLKSINNILDAINKLDYLSLGKVINGRFEKLTDDTIATLTYDEANHKVHLLVNSNEDNNLVLKLRFNLKLEDNGTWTVQSASENGEEIKFDYTYVLNFANATSFLEPEVIKNEQDFLNLNNLDLPTRNYILGNDLILTNYTPIDAHIASFDGNGRKIIIQSFAEFNDAEIYVGLFKQVYENMLVSNLEVVYLSTENSLGWINRNNPTSSTFYDLSATTTAENVNAYFGGITPKNSGIITNCQVSGAVALRVSKIENQRTADFNMGGLVCNNDGYITHCDSTLAMVGRRANIGGLVYANGGKIASCSYLAENDVYNFNMREIVYSTETGNGSYEIDSSGFIFAYDTNAGVLVGGLVVYNGGLAVNNSAMALSATFNEISMCNVIAGGNGTNSNITAQNGTVGGFVYSNSGRIYNCYTNYDVFGNSGNFAGFVYTNAGEISLCYTYVNKGVLASRAAYTQFTSKTAGESGITDSYEVIDLSNDNLDKYLRDNKVDGVDYITVENRFLKASYSKLMFGDDMNGTWQILSAELPSLTSVSQKVKLDSVRQSTESMFYGLRTIRREEIKTEVDNQIITTYKYVLLDNGYGTRDNPILLYNLETWDYYLVDGTSKYFRLVTDIDFEMVKNNPQTSTRTFSGNIQGNNMLIDNIMISSSNNLSAIGLFKNLIASTDIEVENVVANLKLNSTRFTASQTQAVGLLAGIIENYKIYNIELSSNNNVLLGANAVGGLAGVVRGNFDLDGITSSVNVNAESKSSSNYSIYMSHNNGFDKSYNLASVHYAGSVAGILDGYFNSNFNINEQRNLTNAYINVKNINVNSQVTVIGDIVGVMFGFVGERVQLTNALVDAENGNIIGKYYAGGLVGENRGVISNGKVQLHTENVNIFANSKVCAGLIGLDLGGLVLNSSAKIDIISNSNTANTTVGGLVGRSVNGFVKNSNYSGKLLGQFTGGVVGSLFDKTVFSAQSSAVGALNTACVNDNVIPNDKLSYFDEAPIEYIENVGISVDSLNYWFENLSSFYTHRAGRSDLLNSIVYYRVLGLAIGTVQANFDENEQYSNLKLISKYGYNSAQKQIVFNGENDIDTVGMVANANVQDGVNYDTPFANIINTMPNVSGTHLMFVIGANLGSLDSWARDKYTSHMVIFTSEQVVELKLLAAAISEGKPVKISETSLKYYIYFNSNNNQAYYEIYPREDLPEPSEDYAGLTCYYALEFDYSFLTQNIKNKTIENVENFSDENSKLLIPFSDENNYFVITFEFEDETHLSYQFNMA